MEFLSSTAHGCLVTVGHVANRFYSWSAVRTQPKFFITTRPDTKICFKLARNYLFLLVRDKIHRNLRETDTVGGKGMFFSLQNSAEFMHKVSGH